MKKTKVAVRERVTDPITRPPLAYRSVRLSPVPVLPPTTIAVPSAARKLWLARRAVPLSTVSTSARRTTAAISGKHAPRLWRIGLDDRLIGRVRRKAQPPDPHRRQPAAVVHAEPHQFGKRVGPEIGRTSGRERVCQIG